MHRPRALGIVDEQIRVLREVTKMTNTTPKTTRQILAEDKSDLTLTIRRSTTNTKHILPQVAATHHEDSKMATDIAEPNPDFERRSELFENTRFPI